MKNIEKYKVLFYDSNKEDSNVFVPKVYGIGWTVNWANPIPRVLILVTIGFIAMRIFLR